MYIFRGRGPGGALAGRVQTAVFRKLPEFDITNSFKFNDNKIQDRVTKVRATFVKGVKLIQKYTF